MYWRLHGREAGSWLAQEISHNFSWEMPGGGWRASRGGPAAPDDAVAGVPVMFFPPLSPSRAIPARKAIVIPPIPFPTVDPMRDLPCAMRLIRPDVPVH